MLTYREGEGEEEEGTETGTKREGREREGEIRLRGENQKTKEERGGVGGREQSGSPLERQRCLIPQQGFKGGSVSMANGIFNNP